MNALCHGESDSVKALYKCLVYFTYLLTNSTALWSVLIFVPLNVDGCVGLSGDHKPRWFTRPQTVTHPSTNRALRRVTSLIETNALPL